MEKAATEQTVAALRRCSIVHTIFLLSAHPDEVTDIPDGCQLLPVSSPVSACAMEQIARYAFTEYILLYTQPSPLEPGYRALERMTDFVKHNKAGMAYSNHYKWKDGEKKKHPVCDYQEGSVRDDFDFGPLLMFRSEDFRAAAFRLQEQEMSHLRYAGLYAIRLILSQYALPTHINEYLYTVNETDSRLSGEKQFDYVNPRNREVQIEMEKVFTRHLQHIGAYLAPRFREVNLSEGTFGYEVSVIIPVRNRARTIDDAIRSVLEQQTDFPFNLIIVDNHSTDGTTEIISRYKEHPQVIHICPECTDLGIGGCWDLAIRHPHCGRFAVQLDSDDLYSSPHTLSTIVQAFYEQQCAMIIGSYRMTDFHLNTLPPGLIDHREWTEDNGRNNALRINGLGAPRAFFTPLLRHIGVPNVSYGEDYALGLAFSRHYRIGRIYEELYLCRRWEGNSDAALNIEQVNANNHYKDSLRTLEINKRKAENKGIRPIIECISAEEIRQFIHQQSTTWEPAKSNHEALSRIQIRQEEVCSAPFTVQLNPARMVSTGAKVDAQSIQKRPCFLCSDHRPKEQGAYPITGGYEMCINPYPILPQHFTLISPEHEPQRLGSEKILRCLFGAWENIPEEYALFYNGPLCGASAPDHFHLQGAPKDSIPLIGYYENVLSLQKQVLDYEAFTAYLCYADGYPCPLFALEVHIGQAGENLLKGLLEKLPLSPEDKEPKLNLLAWHDDYKLTVLIIPRSKHRPECYSAKGENQLLISPGALDIAGIIVTARKEDFERVSAEDIRRIVQEVGLSREEAQRVIAQYQTNNRSKA